MPILVVVGFQAKPPSAHTAERSRLRRWLMLLVALAALAPVVAAWLLSSAAGSGSTSPFQPLVTRPPKAAPAGTLPPGSGSLVALVRHRTDLRARPGGRVLAALGLRTSFGSPQALWVLRLTQAWLGVGTPLLGNGRIGWIPRGAVVLLRDPWSLHVSLPQRRLTVLDGGHVVARYPVAIGRPDAPTPTGRFQVTDRLLTGDPAGPYGCCVLALSALSPHAIEGWTGGNRIAIHSTTDTSSIGEDASHGCLRVTLAEGRWLIDHVPDGTPTVISG